MKAVAVHPGKAGSAHLAELPRPVLSEVPGGRGVRVEVLRVGVDGTDREIHDAEYGEAPDGSSFLVLGHESLGRVVEVGPAVTELAPGDLVVAMVRRPGTSVYDSIGMQDFTTDDEYFERGISRLHGFLTEEYVDSADWLVKLPATLSRVGVLLEPMTVVEKGIGQAFEAQRRLRVWRPRRAAVLGAGTIGLMATLVLRLRGLAVDTFALAPRPNVNASLVEATGARYVCAQDRSVVQVAEAEGGYDLVFECSGFSPLVFEGMRALTKNGALVLSSITGGGRTVEVPSDHINQSFVLGNKLMLGTVNAGRVDFEQGVRDLIHAEAAYPGWLEQLLTHPVRGFDAWPMLFEALNGKKGVIKAFLEVRPS
jgi:threonine dehydrogenase-like Zn-dependent dehydrogenase